MPKPVTSIAWKDMLLLWVHRLLSVSELRGLREKEAKGEGTRKEEREKELTDHSFSLYT
ncbi:MAG: hypothetical protein WDO16_16800 [Bacteroidota bacterium]